MEPSWILGLAGVLVVALAVVVAILVARRRQHRPRVAASSRPSGAERLRQALAATRDRLVGQVDAALARTAGDIAGALPELEEALITADVGVRTAGELVGRVRGRVPAGADPVAVRTALRDEIEAMLASDEAPLPTARPWVVLVLGVNGVGKTTTVGKLAALHAAAGRRVLLVAGDTFRAAAIEQLGVWAERSGADVIRQAAGANPAAVVFDGIKAAVARAADVVLVDTGGRLHTRTNLMEELRKVERIVARELPGAPHEVLLVIDATTGQNAIAQARTFAEALRVTGVVLTKLDGTARGGVALAVRREIGVPIRFIGIGEGIEDLRPFDARQFAGALLGPAAPESATQPSRGFDLTSGSAAH